MKNFSQDAIAQVLAANDIVDVIGSHIELKHIGSGQYKGLSPFTNERNPSFTVSQNRQLYYCFSSGRGGSVLTFLMEFEGLSFKEALKKLADRAGIRLQASNREEDETTWLRKRVVELYAFAATAYRKNLQDPTLGAPGRAYLKTRQLKETTEARFSLGLAPDAWSHLYDAAVARKFLESELAASGLARRGDKGFYDFFRNRVIFPIRNLSGDVVAFGGRDLGDSPAKYINSPESPAYKKGQTLYGLYEAREALRAEKRAILVEGYFDLLRCADAGIGNVVATCGTALTEYQAQLIKRYVPEIVVVYDGDTAGIRAALKGIGILVAAGLTVFAMAPPNGQDPDDFILAAGAQEFRDHVFRARDFISFYVDMNDERRRTVEGRTEIAHELFAIIRTVNDTIRAEQYLKSIALKLGINEWTCRREYESFIRSRRPTVPVEVRKARNSAPSGPRLRKDDLDFIAAILEYRDLRLRAENALLSMTDDDPTLALAQKLLRVDRIFSVHDLESEVELHLYSAAVNSEVPPHERARRLVEQRLAKFQIVPLKRQVVQLQEQIRLAERDQDFARVKELCAAISNIQKKIKELSAA